MGHTSSSTFVPESHQQHNTQADRARTLSNITYLDVKKCIEELNAITRNMSGRNERQLKFVIKHGTNRSAFGWKRKIKIQCQKMDTLTQFIVSTRTLNLHQFLDIHREITEWVTALTLRLEANDNSRNPDQRGLGVSEQETSLQSSPPSSLGNKDSECCCVCMERRACIMLSCCHEFCEICIDNWTRDEEHSNCPLCRTSVAGSDDTWVLMDKSDAGDKSSDVYGYLMRIAERKENLKS